MGLTNTLRNTSTDTLTQKMEGVRLTAAPNSGCEQILCHEAVEFVATLARSFEQRRRDLLKRREDIQQKLDEGLKLDFLEHTRHIREGNWTVPEPPADLRDRRVEITGPASDRKMVINAMNSGAKVFMADFEDANSPTWRNSLEGQVNLRDAVRRTISFVNETGKQYTLRDETAVLIIRPRGWHLVEKHVVVDGEPISASLFDFGLYLFHNAKELLTRGSGPYFYLPKMESHLEARLWDDVFTFSERYLQLQPGSIRATVLIETINAAFEMDEILYELRSHASGLNCGRWDYIFSYIKKHRSRPQALLPDRSLVTMTTGMMHNYSKLAIQTCHRRGAYAIGGMAAQIPIKNDPEANEAALDKVRQDKEREARDGHDGTWVAHPGLVPVAMDVFNRFMPYDNQLNKRLETFTCTSADLITPPRGPITESGVRTNVRVGLEYTEAWLRGYGAVPINYLMEDAATAEISRAQLWQWIRYARKTTDTGLDITLEYVARVLHEELSSLKQSTEMLGENPSRRFDEAAQILDRLISQEGFEEFLTIPGYDHLD